jgi:hypothetical protein
MPAGSGFIVAGLLMLAGSAVEARTLTLSAQRMHGIHADARMLHVVIADRLDTGSLQLWRNTVPAARSGSAGTAWSARMMRPACRFPNAAR